ncbi:MAG: CBS domain-containing protein [Desulfatiglans sp.]|jgi:CBS domain-containing protein|nr:CBS domain-containing protein [Desulfatiglans sp.]
MVKDNQNPQKIADLIVQLKKRKLPVIDRQAGVNEIIDAFVASNHSRILYVVDKEQRLKGVLSLGNLVRHVFFHYHDPPIDSRSLVSMFVSETADDFMQREPVCAMPSENVQDVLQRMIDHNTKEIPIVDSSMRVVADLTIIDLLHHYKPIKAQDMS